MSTRAAPKMPPDSQQDEEKQPPSDAKPAVAPVEYPPVVKRILIMIALYLSMFLITLDQNIIATAIPRITDEFHSIDDIGWYGSAYLLTTCSFQLLMGKVYKHYPAKPLFLTGVFFFEVGSAICGAAPSSIVFIVGRAVAGFGASGLFSGLMVIMFHTIPLRQRPLWQGAAGALFAVASVVGPLVGGALTDSVTWRWCFYLNLPIGAFSILVTVFLVHLPNQKLEPRAKTLLGRFQQLDPIGNLAFFPGIVCLILALQWGGTRYSWSNPRIIALLVACIVLVAVFIGIQAWKQENATLPPRIVRQRSIAAAMFFCFFNGAGMMVLMYYLPVWFQAVKGASAVNSGLMLLPTILSLVVASIASGIVISRVGYYAPFYIVSSILTPIGAGVLCTFTKSTSQGMWIGSQVVFGFGAGLGVQQHLNVVQTVLERSDIAVGSAAVMLVRFLGPAIFIPIAQNIFLRDLVSKLTALPGVDAAKIIKGGATELRSLVSGNDLDILLTYYNAAIVKVFYIAVGTCAVTIFASVCVEWRSLKAKAQAEAGRPK
ncbi:Major facilitator superfamily domain, general substrate transporter [Cordyceps fumosorosea ARSEF 2679]|uniref:Major facilitator superfamily domain, general substrate transporter n=1 Tax=Cordyceps fumosorosea (strain ARSEF 2679) TaxID=1081104 RepID=A0A167TQW6_CORFA|nr:Major facilitator superfamily domain, general substrate transporter [Cordyceps fumosorosea ARSEF 2679]OAA60853.1 Major facilitator superfamily domain, general substrate transporter [Cordyceps fumosorosea ARSEF 2679]